MNAKAVTLLAFLMARATVAGAAAADDSFTVLGEAELDGITAGTAGASVLGAGFASGSGGFAGTNTTAQTFAVPYGQPAGGGNGFGQAAIVNVQATAWASALTFPSLGGSGAPGLSVTALAQVFVFVVVAPR